MVNLAKAMKNANRQMDAIGVQAHAAAGLPTATVKQNIDKLAATGYPIIVSEYDINEANDETQRRIMEEQFTMFWNHPKVVGVTYWGYVLGSTWVANSGLLKSDGTERPALKWLVDFVKKTPNPPNDFPNLFNKKTTAKNNPLILVRSNSEDKNIKKIFDLRGRVVSYFAINSQSSSLSNLSGNYIIENGDSYSRIIKIRK
jgi:hypothetical protein